MAVEPNQNHSCPNCIKEYQKSFDYCPHCGQKNEPTVLTFKELFTDLMGSMFSFDSKAFNSLPKLIFKPGHLTVDYLNGKRASNLSPFRMYLFFSVVLFLLLPMVVSEDNIFNSKEASDFKDGWSEFQDSVGINQLIDSLEIPTENDEEYFSLLSFDTRDSSNGAGWKLAQKMMEDGYSAKEATDSIFTDLKPTARLAVRQALKMDSQKGKGLLSVFFNSLSYALFLYLPLFALFLKLLYVRRKRLYIEHFIFSLHIFSFIFFILILLALLNIIQLKLIAWIPLIIILAYFYFALFKVYNQSWGKTLLKYIALLFVNTIFIIPVAFIVTLLISLIFY